MQLVVEKKQLLKRRGKKMVELGDCEGKNELVGRIG